MLGFLHIIELDFEPLPYFPDQSTYIFITSFQSDCGLLAVDLHSMRNIMEFILGLVSPGSYSGCGLVLCMVGF